MKINKVKKLLIVAIMMLPMFIKAETYKESTNKANNYIFNYNDYNDYILIDDERPFNYEDGINKVDMKFKTGGFLSKDEYLITNVYNNSYLSTGIEYWTLSQYDYQKNYTIDIMLSNKDIEQQASIKVTQFIQNDVEVAGTGTKNDPWVFKDIFSVTLKSTKQERGLLSLKECSQGEKKEQIVAKKFDGSQTYFYICPTEHFEYNAEKSSCKDYVTALGENKFELADSQDQKLVDNMICTIDFAYQTTKVTFESAGENPGTNPNPVYLANNKEHWFTDSKGYNSITGITPPVKKGYIFNGYYTERNGAGAQIIKENGVFNTTSFNGTVLYPKWTPIKFYVSFNINGGNNSISTIQCTYDQECTVPQATGVLTRNNHTFWGWTLTKQNPKGGNPSVDIADKGSVKNRLDTEGQTLTLYAMWRIDYYCNGGATLREDSSRGWICTYGATAASETYAYGCSSCGTCFYNEPYSCSGGWYCATGWAGAQCYRSVPYTCCSDSTCYGTRTVYRCGSGSVYSGSGSSTVCYTPALSS